MKKKIISLILILCMVLTSSLYLVACDNGGGNETEPEDTQTETELKTEDNVTESGDTEAPTETDVPTESETDTEASTETSTETESQTATVTETETETKTETEPVTESETESATEPDPDSIVYENGDDVKSAGLRWDDEAFASFTHTFDESKAVTKTAEEMLALLMDRDLMAEGEVYRVTEALVLESNTKYYGNLAAVIAEGGIVIKDAEEIVIKELIVKGSITVVNSKGITFFKLDLQGGETGVSIDKASSDVAFKSSKVSATDTAIKTEANLTSLYQCYLSADKGLIANANDVAVYDTKVVAVSAGISICGTDNAVRNCLCEIASDGIGIDVLAGSKNTLVALNSVKDAQNSIRVSGGFNCVVLLNSAIRITGTDNTNLYVVENKLGGAIKLENNKYLLCDANTFKADGKTHSVVNTNNTEINGNNLHDVDARVEYGANEEILPHTNKDLFIDMELKTNVKDISQTKTYSISNYIRIMAKSDSQVIIPPGAYTVTSTVNIDAPQSGTTFYCFGAYIERDDRDFTVTNGVITQKGTILGITASNIVIQGLTIGYAFQPAGQVHVLDKLGNNQLLVITNAGYMDDYGQSNLTEFANNANYMYHAGTRGPWNNTTSYVFVKNDDGSVLKNEDGSMIIQLTGNNAAKYYASIGKGDVFGCRLSGDNSSTISVSGSNGVLFKDMVMYGYSSALGIVAGGRATGISLERVHNTARNPLVIDKETYDKYAALQEQYKVDLEISIDEQGRYRGGIPRIGSVDATHITGTKEGVDATSCLFEYMCDDGSNQRASSSRLAGYKDNGDGTTTLYFKGTVSETYWGLNTNALKTETSPTSCPTIKKGDVVYIYASTGHVLLEAASLTDAKASTCSDIHVSHVDKLDNSQIKDGDITSINGIFSTPQKCVDGLCDICGKVTHIDHNNDTKCDLCNTYIHLDRDKNNKCDSCGSELLDENSDGLNDKDNKPILKERFYVSYFSDANGALNVTAGYNKSGWRKITYKTIVYEIQVNTSDLNQRALAVIDEQFDLTCNEYAMDNKVLVDNLSANSIGFTFDNVLIKDKAARGILCKTHNVTIKNCTFRNFSSTGVLLSVETTWGESTVPKNVTITGCLFDNVSMLQGTQTDLKYACIAIQGLGATAGKPVDVSADSLPCRQIFIIGNKFQNVNNKYAISVSAAQDIIIRDNVFVGQPTDTNRMHSKAVNINGAMNIEISGNTYSDFTKDDVTMAIVALNYKGLTGKDVEGKFPTNKEPKQ